MTAPPRQWLLTLAPIAVGAVILLVASQLLPGPPELAGVDQRTRPAPAPAPSVSPSATPETAADTATAGQAVDPAAPDPAAPPASAPTWRQRFEAARAGTDPASAAALLAQAAAGPSDVPDADIIAAGYALDRPDLILRAATSGAIAPPDPALTLDLARRLETTDLIPALDRVARSDWRAADPWLALRIAKRRGDTRAALQAAARLPAADRTAAEEDILRRSGNRAALAALLRRQASAPGADQAAIAERLLAAGDRDGAILALQATAARLPAGAPAARRLLYLLGPRPAPRDVAWLLQRASGGPAGARLDWLLAYAVRATPQAALAELARHPLAGQTEVLITRLQLARSARDEAAARTAAAQLLDGRRLAPAEVKRIAAVAPANLRARFEDKALPQLAKAGAITPEQRLDRAWAAWNRGDAAGTAAILDVYLEDRGDDAAALRLRGDAEAKLAGDRAARPWFERALARTPSPSRGAVELLERLGRRGEATAMVTRLRSTRPDDRALAALHARLLIAQGEPGRAREVLAQ